MAQARTWVDLDVHAAKVVAAIVDVESGELQVQRLPSRTAKVVEFCAGLPAPVRVSHEAGPPGFGLARALEAAGMRCLIAAPGRSRGRQPTGLRSISATLSWWCGC